MENKLEQLLNTLIQRGWKPFEESRIDEINRAEQYAGNWNWCCWGGAMQRRKSTRQLVSKESGLWQFVCENRLQPTNKSGGWDYGDGFTGWTCMAYEYRLIESALCDEDKLEEFLLNSIKLG